MLIRNLRFAGRLLRRYPTFTAVTILTLALGIGVNTAIASVVNGILLDPWPYEDLDELMALRGSFEHDPVTWVSYFEYQAWRERNRTFEDLAVHRQVGQNLKIDGVVEAIIAVEASANLFSMLDAEPFLGRVFTVEEDRLGAAGVTVLSHAFWQRRFGGRDPLGETLWIEQKPYEVIGIMGPDMLYPHDFRQTALWLPIGQVADGEWTWNYETHPGVSVTGRLAEDITLAEARVDLDRIATELAAEQPVTHKGRGVSMQPVLERSFGALRPRLLALTVAVSLVLAIACVNVASLLLVRGAGRAHELAVRHALGASRRQLVGQLLAESVLLALAGAMVGLLVARATVWGLMRVAHLASMPAFREVTIDGGILLLTAVIALGTGLMVGLVPALSVAHRADVESLHGGTKSSPGRRRISFVKGLVVVEVAFALVIVICAMLSLRSFQRILGDDPGFDPHGLLTFYYVLPAEGLDDEEELAVFETEMLERLERVPGVTSATVTVPIVAYWSATFEIVGRPPGERKLTAEHFWVSPGFFSTLGIEIVEGRGFVPADRLGAAPVAVVDQGFAERFWPGESAVGQRLLLSSDDPGSLGREVVGVVSRASLDGVHRGAEATFFLPTSQKPVSSGWGVLRTSVGPEGQVEPVRAALRELMPGMAVSELWTMDYRLSIHRGAERLGAALLGGFAILAFVLAAVGLYGALASSATARRRELGIRMALGATQDGLFRLVLRQGLGLALVGIAVGWGLAAFAVRLLASQLYATDPYSPSSWLAATLLVGVVSAVAASVPAWWARHVRAADVLHRE